MKPAAAVYFLSLIFVASLSSAEVVFASVEEGKKILMAKDDFVERMSPFDRAARRKTDKNVSVDEYLEFVGKNVLPWDDEEKKTVTAVWDGIQKGLAPLPLAMPERIFFIKTTGLEEGGAAYTRANAIVIPRERLAAPRERTEITLAHELFHILARANPKLRERIYAAIGFVKGNELEFPAELKLVKITNPDAPINDHYIRIKVDGEEHWALPILFSNDEKYDVAEGADFFDYLVLRLLLVDGDPQKGAVKPLTDGTEARMVDVEEAEGFFQQVGENTAYIFHPEEILADNFALLVIGRRDVRSPETLAKVEAALKAAAGSR